MNGLGTRLTSEQVNSGQLVHLFMLCSARGHYDQSTKAATPHGKLGVCALVLL